MAISTGILTTAGITALGKMLYSSTADHALYIAYGTGLTAATASDTEMEEEVSRVAADTVEKSSSSFRIHHNFTLLESNTLSEVGVFTALEGGTMLYHGIAGSSCRHAALADDILDTELLLTPEQGSF